MSDKTKAQKAAEEDEFAALQRLRDVAPPGFQLKIFRKPAAGKDWEWLDDWEGDEIPSHGELRERYGGGKFRYELRTSDGKWVPGGSAILTVAGAPKVDGGPSGGVDPTVRYAFDMLREVQKLQLESRPKPHQENMAQLITAVAGAVGVLAGILRPAGAGGSLAGQMADLRALVETVRELTPPAPEGNVGADGGGVFGAVVQGLNKLLEVYQQQQGKLPAATPPGGVPAPEMSGPTPQDTTAPPPATPPPAGQDWVELFRPYVPQLLDAAADDSDPELYADLVLDLCERKYPPAVEFLAEKLAGDSGAAALFETQFTGAYQVPAELRRWFADLFKALRGALLERQVDAAQAAAAPAAQPGPQLVDEKAAHGGKPPGK